MSAVTIEPVSGGGLKWALADGLTVTKRNMLGMMRTPEIILYGAIQPIMFVLLFSYVFGGAINVPGAPGAKYYREYLMAGIFAQNVLFGLMWTSIGLAEDMQRGIVDRFRSLPMARSAVLTGRALADTALNAFTLLIMILAGLLVGWRVHSSVLEALAGFGLLLLLAFAMCWIGAFIGLSVRDSRTAQSAGMILFPVTFLSNAFVPTQGMPDWLRAVADWNPFSTIVTACRALFGNPNPVGNPGTLPGDHPALVSLGWAVLVLVVFVPLAVRKYRVATSR